jgi:hypothetical protein
MIEMSVVNEESEVNVVMTGTIRRDDGRTPVRAEEYHDWLSEPTLATVMAVLAD